MNNNNIVPSKCSLSIHGSYSSIPKNIVGKLLLQSGHFLTYPIFKIANTVTKLTSRNTRPGKPLPPKNSLNIELLLKARKIVNLSSVAVFIIPAVFLALIGFPLCIAGNKFVSDASLLRSSCKSKIYDPNKGLHIMTYNTGLMPGYIRNINDLRSSNTRATEIAENIATNENTQPDIICFQEVFDRNASKNLLGILQNSYSNIVYNVAPNEVGLNSGLVIASKFPIIDINFRPFNNLSGEDYLSNKGLLKVTVDLGNNKSATIYNAHLQAKTGKKYDQIRFEELAEIKSWIQQDQTSQIPNSKYENQGVFFMGDLNLSIMNEDGEINENHAYTHATRNILGTEFQNSYYETHDLKTATRNPNSEPIFVNEDSKHRAKQEPTGTWYKGAGSKNRGFWGTTEWQNNTETVNNCIYDHQFMYNPNNKKPKWVAHAEIRNLSPVDAELKNQESGLSDHLPMSVIYKETCAFTNKIDELYKEYQNKENASKEIIIMLTIMRRSNINMQPMRKTQERLQDNRIQDPFKIINLHREYLLKLNQEAEKITKIKYETQISEELADLDYIEKSLRSVFNINT